MILSCRVCGCADGRHRYNGARTAEAAKHDNELTRLAWQRVWPEISPCMFGGSRLELVPWGSEVDVKNCIDAWIGGVSVGLRIQEDVWQSFTGRADEVEKLLDGRDRSAIKLQAYLEPAEKTYTGRLLFFGCVSTDVLLAYHRTGDRNIDVKRIHNGLLMTAWYWRPMQRAGFKLVRRYTSVWVGDRYDQSDPICDLLQEYL